MKEEYIQDNIFKQYIVVQFPSVLSQFDHLLLQNTSKK